MKRVAASRVAQLTAVGIALTALLGYLVHHQSTAPPKPPQHFLGEAVSRGVGAELDGVPQLQ